MFDLPSAEYMQGFNPECGCNQCLPDWYNMTHMVLCPDCGNKRCPKANDHRNACTKSNATGQEGSAY